MQKNLDTRLKALVFYRAIISQGAQRLFIHISFHFYDPKRLKVSFISDTIPDTRKVILKVRARDTNLPTPHYDGLPLPPWWQNMDFQIMQKKITEQQSYPKFHHE